jgi:hypothetical protein
MICWFKKYIFYYLVEFIHRLKSYTDRSALVLNIDQPDSFNTGEPPEWYGFTVLNVELFLFIIDFHLRNDDLNQIQFEITRVKSKIKELSILHDKHLNKPTLDDNIEEEKAIDRLTQEITKVCTIERTKFAFNFH